MLKRVIKSVLMYEISMCVVFYFMGIYQEQDLKKNVFWQFILGITYIVVYVIIEKRKRRKNDRDKRLN